MGQQMENSFTRYFVVEKEVALELEETFEDLV